MKEEHDANAPSVGATVAGEKRLRTEPSSSRVDAPVFVVGVTRSGTTLVERILNRHPHLSIYHETHFIRKLWSRSRRRVLRPEQVRPALEQVLNIEKQGLRPEAIEARFLETDRSLPSLFDTILRLKMEKQGKTRYGEKTPSHFWYLDVLLSWYPKAKIIFMIRDPRDVHGSFKHFERARRLRRWDRTVIGRALYWSYGAHLLEKGRRRYPGHLIKVPFEQLIQDPVPTIQSVCDFIGEAFHEDMLAVGVTNTSFDAMRRKSGIRTEALNRRPYLSKMETVVLEVVCGAYMLKHGYHPSVVPVAFITMLSAVGFNAVLRFGHAVIRKMRTY